MLPPLVFRTHRLEIYDGRVKIGTPFSNLLGVEGARRGCRIHTTHQRITSQEPLYRLEQQLPEKIFIRCQRSFVVNFTYGSKLQGIFCSYTTAQRSRSGGGIEELCWRLTAGFASCGMGQRNALEEGKTRGGNCCARNIHSHL